MQEVKCLGLCENKHALNIGAGDDLEATCPACGGKIIRLCAGSQVFEMWNDSYELYEAKRTHSWERVQEELAEKAEEEAEGANP